MSMTAKTALLNAFESAVKNTKKALQKSWKIATWGNRSENQIIGTIPAIAASGATFAYSFMPLITGGIKEVAVTSTLTAGTFLATKAFMKAATNFTRSSSQTISNIVGDTLSVTMPSPISEKAQEAVKKIHAEEQKQAMLEKQKEAEIRAQKRLEQEERLTQQQKDFQTNLKAKEQRRRDALNPTKQDLQIRTIGPSSVETMYHYLQQNSQYQKQKLTLAYV